MIGLPRNEPRSVRVSHALEMLIEMLCVKACFSTVWFSVGGRSTPAFRRRGNGYSTKHTLVGKNNHLAIAGLFFLPPYGEGVIHRTHHILGVLVSASPNCWETFVADSEVKTNLKKRKRTVMISIHQTNRLKCIINVQNLS